MAKSIQLQKFCRGARLLARSSSKDLAGSNEFDITQYVEAKLDTVLSTGQTDGFMIILRILDEGNAGLPVYVGEFESKSLSEQLPPHRSDRLNGRPSTYDLMKNTLQMLGCRVTKVRISALVHNTYHARVHYCREGNLQETVVDARPSDAINLALRFGAPVYVNKEVARMMGQPMKNFQRKDNEPQSEIVRSCRDVLKNFHDPTVVHKVKLQVAIAENRFEDASQIRNIINSLLQGDRTLSLVVAMESALNDQRYEEAAYLRNCFMQITSDVARVSAQEA